MRPLGPIEVNIRQMKLASYKNVARHRFFRKVVVGKLVGFLTLVQELLIFHVRFKRMGFNYNLFLYYPVNLFNIVDKLKLLSLTGNVCFICI